MEICRCSKIRWEFSRMHQHFRNIWHPQRKLSHTSVLSVILMRRVKGPERSVFLGISRVHRDSYGLPSSRKLSRHRALRREPRMLYFTC
ncbi:hypothetical protein AR158_c328L [Paramecium bursaria Chlorella virus AR158]|uniref:hypothetical protein n=1 Tax=Paramecium bursaria Chlorella virus AR158 TaxID=380598 RepID=UPI00015AA92C|nr:hypothetical protein AR158_c328L [Paramecium bursaria Chlorella virus AR158]ABU43873.1 hypothetical protein AR158_c328L [Paramecium bursaria Chlorella virus AR158]